MYSDFDRYYCLSTWKCCVFFLGKGTLLSFIIAIISHWKVLQDSVGLRMTAIALHHSESIKILTFVSTATVLSVPRAL